MKYNGKVLATGGSVASFLKRMERKIRMKKTWKRLVSLLLTAILLAAVLCLPTALAAEKAPNDYGIKKIFIYLVALYLSCKCRIFVGSRGIFHCSTQTL